MCFIVFPFHVTLNKVCFPHLPGQGVFLFLVSVAQLQSLSEQQVALTKFVATLL